MKKLMRSPVSVLLLACFLASASEATAQDLTAPLFNHIELLPPDTAPVRHLVLRNEVVSFAPSQGRSVTERETPDAVRGVMASQLQRTKLKNERQVEKIVVIVIVAAVAVGFVYFVTHPLG